MITYFQAIILGLLQGVTELFPISSLGHSVLIADLFGWTNLVHQQSASESNFLSFLVMLHIATATALIIFYRQQWVRIIRGFFRSLPKLWHSKRFDRDDSDAMLAWLLIAATIPAGLFGVVFERALRTQFGTPMFAVGFIILNGILLIKGDKIIRGRQLERPRQRKHALTNSKPEASKTSRMVSDHLSFGRAIFIGIAQIGALFAGISRSGITMIAGVRSGLNHQDAARFSFLLATPIILAAGLYKLPYFLGPHSNGVRPQIFLGAVAAGIAAYLSVRFLDKYFEGRSLKPFGQYCIGFGLFMLVIVVLRGPQ